MKYSISVDSFVRLKLFTRKLSVNLDGSCRAIGRKESGRQSTKRIAAEVGGRRFQTFLMNCSIQPVNYLLVLKVNLEILI